MRIVCLWDGMAFRGMASKAWDTFCRFHRCAGPQVQIPGACCQTKSWSKHALPDSMEIESGVDSSDLDRSACSHRYRCDPVGSLIHYSKRPYMFNTRANVSANIFQIMSPSIQNLPQAFSPCIVATNFL
jgi:hypothetical protein